MSSFALITPVVEEAAFASSVASLLQVAGRLCMGSSQSRRLSWEPFHKPPSEVALVPCWGDV